MANNPSPEDQQKRANDYLIVVPDFIRLKDYDLALLQVERALSIDPGNAKALEYRKRIIAIQGRPAQPPSPPPTAEVKPDEKEILQSRKQEKLRELEEERRRLEKIRQEFEELQRQEEELHRKEEEERKRRIEEVRKVEEQRRLEEEERRQLLELKRKEEEQKRQEEMSRKKEEEERLRREEEERKRQEELRKKEEEEERRKQEELKRKEEEERKRQEELRRKQEEEERKKQEELKRKQEEERRRQEEVRKKQEEERQRKIQELQSQLEGLKQEEERQKKLEEEARIKQQEQEKRRHEEQSRRHEEERRRAEQQKRKAAEHKAKEEEQKRKEEELRRREVEHLIQIDPLRRLEEETRLAKEKKDRVHAQITVAEDFFSSGHYEQAMAELTKILEVDPSYPRALTLRLRIKQAEEKHKERATAKNGEKTEPVVETSAVVEPVIIEKKKAMRIVKWTGGVVLIIVVGVIVMTQMRRRSGLEVAPQSKPAAEGTVAKPSPETTKTPIATPASVVPTVTAEEHVARANLFIQHRSYQSALQEFDSAAALAPKRVETFVSQADVDLKVGKYPDAIKALSHAAELVPRDTTILLMTAFAYYLNGAYEDGFKYHEQVLALTVDSIRYLVGPVADAILSSKALLAKYGGRVKAAFEGSMSGAPNDFVNRYRYARLLLALGSTKEANDVLKKNVDYLVEEYRNHPDDGLITMYLALSMTRQGHFSEAEGFAKDAKDLARGNPEILYKIAQMYALQMHSSRGQATIAQMKKKALQSVHEAVNLRFMLNELTNADLYSVYGKDFVVAARLPLK
jgi:tetratricopeptide (TPR) repeat protein